MSVRGPKKKKISSDRAEGSETVSSTITTSSPAVDAKTASKNKAKKQKHKEANEVYTPNTTQTINGPLLAHSSPPPLYSPPCINSGIQRLAGDLIDF
jgi:hypothetical protein